MTAQTKTTLKGYFETGDTPTEAQFTNLIDTIGTPTLTVARLPLPSCVKAVDRGDILRDTNITVAIKQDDGSAGTSQTIYWRAWV